MKVLVLADSLSFGGIGRYCINLVSGLRTLGVDVMLMAPGKLAPNPQESWLWRQAGRSGLDLHLLPMRHTFDIGAILRLGRFLQREGVSIVHSQAYRSDVISRLAIRVADLTTQSVITLHRIPANLAKSPRLRLYVWLDLMTSRWSSYAIAVDESSLKGCLGLTTTTQPTSIIHNGTPLPDLAIDAFVKPPVHIAADIVIGFVGRLAIEKGIDYLAESIRQILLKCSNAGFLVVGDGPQMGLLESLLSESFGQRVALVGHVDDVSIYYKMMHLVILPSTIEGLPMTALEAMSYSIPIVGTSVGGMPELIRSGVNGILVPPGDVKALVEAVLRLIADPDMRKSFGRSARATIERDFNSEVMCKQTLQVYERVLNENCAASP